MTLQHILKVLLESGTANVKFPSQKRNIWLTNLVSVVISTCILLVFIYRIWSGGPFEVFWSLIVYFFIGFCPILLNNLQITNLSRIFVSWFPTVMILINAGILIAHSYEVETSTFVGVRIFLIPFATIPFLVFNASERGYLAIGLTVPLICLFFFDPILDFFGFGYSQMGLHDSSYSYNSFRIIISYFILGISFFFLKNHLEKGEELNIQLLTELEKKNKTILQQAAKEVNELDRKLQDSLLDLKEREFILNESQRIAKIGSWRYVISNGATFWSDEMYSIFGVDRTFQPVAESFVLFQAESHEAILREYNKLLSKGEILDVTASIKTPLGQKKWIRISGYPLYNGDQVSGAIGICHDITFYKEAEDRIVANEKKYRSLFEQASDSILVVDFDGRMIDVNSTLCKTLGYTKEELLQKNISDLIESQDLKSNPVRFDSLAAGDRILNQRHYVHKSGAIIEVEANIKRFGNDSIMAIVRDVTELRKVQRQTQLSEAMFRTAFDHSAIGMALTSTHENRFLKVNARLCEITGYTEQELLMLCLHDITHKEDIGADEVLIGKCLAGDIEVYEMEKRYIQKSGSIRWVKIAASLVRQASGTPLYFVRHIEDISEKKIAEQEKEETRYLLNERVKERTILYRASEILQQEKSVDDLMHEIAQLLPSGWQYPDITAARIVIGGIEFKTSNFSQGVHKQTAEFVLPQGMKGLIEVVYLEDRPQEVEGAFFAEERDLINLLAEMLRMYFVRRHESNALKSSEANLNATINNTELLIWSVDRNLNLITFNRAFQSHIKKYYGLEIKIGAKILGKSENPGDQAIALKWEHLYRRVLEGESITLEENRFGIDFNYSLSPIIEEDKGDRRITGVNVFATNVTEQKIRSKELAEANKKMGEFRLMALRSVMSPHFIFNVLNSIQFFIAGNDRLNAINYLSKFSKLMRNILTNSVDNKIKLNEEIEILKNYVQLEMLRFENKFNFNLDIDPKLETESIEIPSLLIQPYVENAILHGLYNKHGKGNLTLRIHEKNDVVVFEIEDDGVGREAAMKIKEQGFSEHKSLGVKLTEERLKLINEHHNVSFEIIDQMKDSIPCGTKVIIGVKI